MHSHRCSLFVHLCYLLLSLVCECAAFLCYELPCWFTAHVHLNTWHLCSASLLLHLSPNDMILYFYSLKWHITTYMNNSNGTTSPRWQFDDGGEDEGELGGLKACQQLSKRALWLSQSSYFALFVSASATLLINTQGSWSDMQWPAWVSPVVNNKLFGFRESGFCLMAALFSQWPHCGIWRELWRCGQNSNNNKYIMVAFLSSIFY